MKLCVTQRVDNALFQLYEGSTTSTSSKIQLLPDYVNTIPIQLHLKCCSQQTLSREVCTSAVCLK